MRIFFLLRLILVFAAFSMQGCLSYKQIVNFQDGDDLKDGLKEQVQNYQQVRLQPDDVVMINVFSFNSVEADRFNVIPLAQQAQMMQQVGGGATATEPIGYRVDRKGNIEMPVLGKVQVQNLTIDDLNELVRKKVEATGYLKDLSVQVRFLTFRITLLGEVNAPGTFIIANPKITILEALGLAKDVTLFSNRDNILVVREQNGIRNYGRINLKSKEVFKSPYFYLQPNDVVYVEPHRTKVLTAPDPATRYISTIIGVVSLATLILTLSR